MPTFLSSTSSSVMALAPTPLATTPHGAPHEFVTLATLGTGPVAPWWLAVPMAMVAMFVIASHVLMLPKAEMPDSRRRIRTANGMLMLFTVPLLAYALGFADPATDQRAFVLAWIMVTGLLVLVLMLALLDMANNYRLLHLQRRALRESLKQQRLQALASAHEA